MDIGLVRAWVLPKAHQEMLIPVSNAIRFDLQAPNEYVRGNTLRFVYEPSTMPFYPADRPQN